MVLVRPINSSWPDLSTFEKVLPEVQNTVQKQSRLGEVCELNLRQCGENEICKKPMKSKRRDGICQCQDGFVKNSGSGICEIQSEVVDPNQPKVW